MSVVVLVAVVLTVLPLVFVWLARRGYNWARVVVAAMGVYVTVDLVSAFFIGRDPIWVMVPTVISGVAAIGATILLMRSESDKYCRAMAAFRKPKPLLATPQQAPYQFPYPQSPYPYNNHQYPPPPNAGAPGQYSPQPPQSDHTGSDHKGPNHTAGSTAPPYGDGQSSSGQTPTAGDANEGRQASDQS